MATVSVTSVETPLVLSLDIGSSSVRSGLYDALGREVGGTAFQTRKGLEKTTDGAATADPDQLLGLLFDCIDRTLTAVGAHGADIVGVGTCTFVGNIMGIDGAGRPVTPLMTYADTRAHKATELLRRTLDEKANQQRTGCRFHPGYAPSQLLWLRDNMPEAFAEARRWITLGEYLELKLFGECAVSSSAASWSGLLNIHACDWDATILGVLGMERDRLSPVVDASQPRRDLVAEFSARWPALASTPWFPAIGDGAAANVGSWCSGPEAIALTMGTSSAMRIALPALSGPIPDGLWCYRIDKARLLLGGALSEGGNVYEWVRTRFKDIPDEALLKALETPDSHGLTILPFLAGERSPGWAGYAKATIHGVTSATRPEDILAAFLEAVAFRIGMVHERLVPRASATRIMASGGALTASPVWLGIIADVLNAEVAITPITEASARGAALLALENLGIADAAETRPDISTVYKPNAARHQAYRAAMKRQRELYDKLVTPMKNQDWEQQ